MVSSGKLFTDNLQRGSRTYKTNPIQNKSEINFFKVLLVEN